MEIKKWVTWKGRRLPIGQDGKIIKLNQDQVNVLKNRKSFVDYGMDDVLATKTELKYANSKYRKINDIKKAYQKRKEIFPENLDDYWKEEKRNRDEIQTKYDKEVEKYKQSVWGQIRILDK